jgi:hypothetical protein
MAAPILASRDFPKGTVMTLLFFLEQRDGFRLKDAADSVRKSAFNHLYAQGQAHQYDAADGEAMCTLLSLSDGGC